MSSRERPAVTNDEDRLRVGFRTRTLSAERLRFIRQLGVTDVFLDHMDTEEEPDEFVDADSRDTLPIGFGAIPSVDELVRTRERIEDAGLRLAGIQSLPYSLYGDVMFGREGKEEALDQVTTLIGNLGAADVSILGYQWNPRGLVPMRTTPVETRGGAIATAFEYDELDAPDALPPELDREYTEADFWENYREFVETVVPVAEEAGVTLALHPNDPPVIESLGGIPRLFGDVDGFERAMDIVPSEAHGLKLCLGCFSEMGEDVESVIERFGSRDQMAFVHFRDVAGTMPRFHETFVDAGNFDPLVAIRALDRVGFDGVVIPDHVPEMEGDTDWRHRARAYTAGYLRSLVHAVETESSTE